MKEATEIQIQPDAGLRVDVEPRPAVPEHLVPLNGGNWAIWKWTVLRGAGFPAAELEDLSFQDCAGTSDDVIRAEDDYERIFEGATSLVRAEIESASGSQRSQLRKVLRALRNGKLPPREEWSEHEQEWDELSSVASRVDAARDRFREAFDVASRQTSAVIKRVASHEKFREAVLWQNRSAVHGSIDALLRMPADSRGAERRRREELVANYLQRYCAKNDTIGFFGPVGWAKFSRAVEALEVRTGPNLLASRQVFFETWAIDTLVEALAKDKSLRPWMAPRLLPFVRVESRTLHRPFQKPVTLPAACAALLQACDGERTAEQLAAEFGHVARGGLRGDAEVYELLEKLVSLGVISWTLEVPYELYPEGSLRRLLERFGDERMRKVALNKLAWIEQGRRQVAASAGDAGKLDAALGELEHRFTLLTSAASTRSSGKMYAARTLVYEDCRRDIEIDVGQDILARLGPPLSLLLTSARWFTHEAATLYRKIFRDIYSDLARSSGTSTVECLAFWRNVIPKMFNDAENPIDEAAATFRRKWAEILQVPLSDRRVVYRSEQLRLLVEATFSAPGPGWKSACHHSPDLMVAAPGIESIKRGEYELVMGELHVASNTLSYEFFVNQHPSPEELRRAYRLDLREPRLVAAVPKHWPELTVRFLSALTLPEDKVLVFSHDTCGVPKSQAVPVSSLVVEAKGDELVVRSRDETLQFDIVEALGDVLTRRVMNHFKLFECVPHTPRVNFDRLV
ncbi:MAG TPA: lantibiotic dehydratase, partial [Pyrinomonadaceae bacterium]